MVDGLVPSAGNAGLTPHAVGADWEGTSTPPQAVTHPLVRLIAALKRYKWVALAMVGLGVVAGIVGIRYIDPQYEVNATIWIQSETPNNNNNIGPIRSRELLAASAWVELLRSNRIADEVVRKLTLYVQAKDPAHKPLFNTFGLADRYYAGQYELTINPAAKRWSLRVEGGNELEKGGVTDTVGKGRGFLWVLPRSAFVGRDERKVKFTVETPRETSKDLIDRMHPQLAPQSNFLRITFQDPDRDLAALTLNTWVNEYVKVAGELKKRNMVEFSRILEGQLDFAQKSLQDAERAHESFRVHTITLPAEGGPVAAGGGGVEMSRDPALASFFDQKIQFDNLKHDREAVEKAIATAAAGDAPYEGLLLIPSVAQSPGAEALRTAFKKQYELQADLASKRSTFTDEFLKDEIAQLNTVQKQTIPDLAQQVLVQLRQREGDYERRISGASKEIQAIPTRTIEEMRLRRAVTVAEGLYTTLKMRYAEAKLAEAGATPDVNILDPAVAPFKPSKNTKPGIIAIALLGGLGAAVGLAMLLDRLDKRFRYPEQATEELGGSIAGVVPRLPKGGLDTRSPEQVLQLVESFRSLRMHVIHAVQMPISMAVSSAAPGDGKSLVSANLAMSFAEAGFKTVLVDTDTRRGSLHAMFGATPKHGITEYLFGEVEVNDVLLSTGHDKLSLIACGRRHHRSPEFLTSRRLSTLVQTLRSMFDVVIFDTPPFVAGIDGYAVSAATGHLLMVVRIGQTQRRLAAAKLSVVDRLPIKLIGTVLNAVELEGEFQYYGYASGYGFAEEEAELISAGPTT